MIRPRSGESGNTIVITSALMLALTVLALGTLRIFTTQSEHLYERRASKYAVLQAVAVAETGVNYAMWESQGAPEKDWDYDAIIPAAPWRPPAPHYDTCYAPMKSLEMETPNTFQGAGDYYSLAAADIKGASASIFYNRADFDLQKEGVPDLSRLEASASVELTDPQGNWARLERRIRFQLSLDEGPWPFGTGRNSPYKDGGGNWFQWYTIKGGSLADAN